MSTLTHVYVATLQTTEGPGWTSVHRSQETAERRLAEKAISWGHLDAWIDASGIAHLDECPGIRSYGVGYLEIEP